MPKKASLQSIADDMVSSLLGTGKFEVARIAPVSSGIQILDELEALTRLPGALVAISRANYDEEGLERHLELLVILADRYRQGGAAKSSGIWELLESIEQLAENGMYLRGIPFSLSRWEPVDAGKENITAFALVFTGAEA